MKFKNKKNILITERVNLNQINHSLVLPLELLPSNKALYNPKSIEKIQNATFIFLSMYKTYFICNNSIRH